MLRMTVMRRFLKTRFVLTLAAVLLASGIATASASKDTSTNTFFMKVAPPFQIRFARFPQFCESLPP